MADSKKLVMTPIETPVAGAIAFHTSGVLDPREVARVSEDGGLIWLKLIGDGEFGPYAAASYTYKRREWK